jgi:hypothetical protein
MAASDAEVVFRALAVLRVRGEYGDGEADDGVLLADMARRILVQEPARPEDPAPPERYRVIVERCPDCSAARAHGAAVEPAVLAEAECDAEIMDMEGERRGHLTRTIPPATRRAVMASHHNRCAVPWCTSRLWLDIHHVRPRSAGGDHDHANLIVLCPAHHRSIHEGLLQVVSATGGGWTFEHADGRLFVPGPGERAHVGAADLVGKEGVVAAAVAHVGQVPAYTDAVANALGADVHRLRSLLFALQAAGILRQDAFGRWHRTRDLLTGDPIPMEWAHVGAGVASAAA